MDLDTLIVAVYCLVDELMGELLPEGERLRQRGPDPELDDREVLTIEIVGEFLGIGTDKGLYAYFRRHYGGWFPTLLKVHRTTFSRQAANLWILKEKLWQGLLGSEELFGEGSSAEVCIVDSFPMPICKKARSHRCKVMADLADYGRDQTNGGFFYGMRVHLLVAWPGVIVRAYSWHPPMSTSCTWPNDCWKGWGVGGFWPTETTGAPTSPSGSTPTKAAPGW